MVIRPGIESEPVTPKSGGSDVKLKKALSMTIRESLYTVIFRELL